MGHIKRITSWIFTELLTSTIDFCLKRDGATRGDEVVLLNDWLLFNWVDGRCWAETEQTRLVSLPVFGLKSNYIVKVYIDNTTDKNCRSTFQLFWCCQETRGFESMLSSTGAHLKSHDVQIMFRSP